jgi:hypothetical protein
MKTIQQHIPGLFKLALQSRQAEIAVMGANTPRSITKAASEKLIADTKLVNHLNKLSSAVLESLSSNKDKDELESKLKDMENKKDLDKSKSEKVSGLTPGRALALSAGLSLPVGLTSMALMNEADDKIDARLAALPGVAAATVAAIIAAKNMGKKEIAESAPDIKELSDAVKVSFVINNLKKQPEFSKTAGDLDIANKRHIAALVNDILFG